MNGFRRMALGVVGIAVAAGCHSATQIIEEPRVDLELDSSGNRGYLVGTPPPPGEQQTTRQLIQTTVELPSYYSAKSRGGAATIVTTGPEPEAKLPGDMTTFGDAAAGSDLPSGPMDSYVVQKGDTLWTIAAKSDVYGDAGKWRWLFDANRDQLASPDRIKAGMTLKVPREQPSTQAEAPLSGKDDGSTFIK